MTLQLNFSEVNQTIMTNTTSSNPNLVDILTIADIIFRVAALGAHIFYFLVVIFIKEMRSISLLYMHQVNFYGLLFILHFVCYIGVTRPSFQDQALNDVLCTMSEILWSSLKYLRSYSVLLLALFRMVAVMKGQMFKKWVNSSKITLFTVIFSVILSIGFTFIFKFAFRNTSGSFYCYDGYSPVFVDGIKYFVFTSVLGVFIPSLLVIVIYIFTFYAIKKSARKHSKSGRVSKKLAVVLSLNCSGTIKRTDESHLDTKSSEILTAGHKKRMKQSVSQKTRLARQFFLINLILLISLVTFMFLSIMNLISEISLNWLQYRLMVRIASIIFQGLVPIVSLRGNPALNALSVKNILKKIKITL